MSIASRRFGPTGFRRTPRVPHGAVAAPVQAPYSLPGDSAGRRPGGPLGPASPPSGQDLQPRGQSKYDRELPQPPPTISDVDVGLNWFSPFQPVAPFGPPRTTWAREWDYPVGTNLDFVPHRLRQYPRWRTMARTWGVIATIIETRKDQLLSMPWEVQLIGKPRKTHPRVDQLREFFRRPDGKKRFDPWARELLGDLFTIDAPTLHVGYRDVQSRPLTCEVLDGATIKVLVDDAGRIPDFPNPAYQQIIRGLPMVDFDETDIIYAPMRPNSDLPIYGFSPVEQIEVQLTEAIRKSMYQLGFWVDGTLPDMIMSVPKDWTARQITAFQAVFDAQLSGNLGQKSKVRFVPEGMKPYDVKSSSGEGLSGGRDEALVRLACYAFSVSPTPFIHMVNRATAESAQQEALQEGLHPLMAWFKSSIMDRIIQEEFGYDDCEFVWLPQSEVDQLKRSQVHMNQVKTGILTLNEVRDELGRTPVSGGDEVLIFTNNGVMTLADAIVAGRAQAGAAAAQAGATTDSSGVGTASDPREVDHGP